MVALSQPTRWALDPQPFPSGGRYDVGESLTMSYPWDPVVADVRARIEAAVVHYHQPLRTHDGRDPRVDLYQELLDGVAYSEKAAIETADPTWVKITGDCRRLAARVLKLLANGGGVK